MIEHAFYPVTIGPGGIGDQIPIRNRPESAESMKQERAPRRLTGMHAPMRQIAFSTVRILAMVALAMLLILGLLPAVLAVQAASR